MKNENAFARVRVIAFFALLCFAGTLAFVALAANPSSGTITPASTPVTWQGTGTGLPPAANGRADCVEGANCDSFTVTISGTPGDWVGKSVKVRIDWTITGNDFDLYVLKDSLDGPQVASDGRFGSNFEEVILDPNNSSIGTGTFVVHVVYYAVTPGDQYAGTISVVDEGVAPVLPAPTPSPAVAAPRYQIHTAPPAGPSTLGWDAGEPSIGVNWLSETGTDGGRSLYIAMTQTLRVTFDDSCPSTPIALWEDKSFLGTSAITFDPILFTDHQTGRTLVSQLVFPAGAALSASAYTEDDGDTWLPSTGAGPGSGIDHQTIGGGGPYAAPVPPLPAYPRPVYYCAQLPLATCAISLDGGQIYGPGVAVDAGGECGGLHGHIKVGPDGTAYLPNKGCGGNQGVIVSENNGATWDVRVVPGSSESESDPAVGIGRGDETGGVGRLYLGYADGDSKAVVATSDDRGLTWSQPLDVGAAFGVNNVAFPVMVAGDDDRAAVAFYGTPTAGGLQGAKFSGIWHLYVAHTYDGGASWTTVDVTPDDPMQRGCIWLGGGSNICRNMLDFMGVDVDKRGRVLIGYNDGCAGAECSQATPLATGNSYTAQGAIARQSGGLGLFAAEDGIIPSGPTVPGAPFVTALRNGPRVSLAWSVSDNGGSAITTFTILRGTALGSESFLANVPGTQRKFIDPTATDPGVTYFYRVLANNAQGSSCNPSLTTGEWAPGIAIARPLGDSNVAPGYQIHDDPAGDQVGGPAAEQDLDVDTLNLFEPSTGPDAGKLVFNLKVANMAAAGNNRMWRIIWASPNSSTGQFYVGMTRDAAGVVSYEYGRVETAVVGLVLGVPSTVKLGAADAGSFTPDGMISIVVSKEKVGNPGTGDLLGDIQVRTYNNVKNEIRTTDAIDNTGGTTVTLPNTVSTANDLLANASTYQVVGPIPGLIRVYSRKTHGTGGPEFKIDLPLVGTAGVEDRNKGDNAHQVVFEFNQPISSAQASITLGGGTGQVASVQPNGNEVIVNLTNVSNAQTVIVNLLNVALNGGTTNISIPMGILHGDVDSSERVDSGDLSVVRQQNLKPLTEGNFRSDVNASGRIDSGDVTVVRRQNLTGLP